MPDHPGTFIFKSTYTPGYTIYFYSLSMDVRLGVSSLGNIIYRRWNRVLRRVFGGKREKVSDRRME